MARSTPNQYPVVLTDEQRQSFSIRSGLSVAIWQAMDRGF